jgi:hypothetical protein
VFALVPTGPPGAGKSSVLEALSDQVVVDDVRHAVIETEAPVPCLGAKRSLTATVRAPTTWGSWRRFNSNAPTPGQRRPALLTRPSRIFTRP